MKKQILVGFLFLSQFAVTAQRIENMISIEQEVNIAVENSSGGNPQGKNIVFFYVMSNKAKSNSNQLGASIDVFYFDSTKTSHLIAEFGMQKQKQTTPNVIEEQKKKHDKIEVKYFDDVKTIAERNCKKVVLVYTKYNVKTEKVVWYDPLIILPFKYDFNIVGLDLIKGLPMEYHSSAMGFTMKHTVTKIDLRTPIADELFIIPR